MTCPGHATILTGSHAYTHLIPLNSWFEPSVGKSIYCVDDDKAPLVGLAAGQLGVSPKRLQTTTFGDELKAAGHKSQVIAVALKDRSAVMLGGHRADLAIWHDVKTFKWISSQYYLKDGKLPDWINELNKGIETRVSKKVKWEAQGQATGLSDAPSDKAFSREFVYGSKEALQTPVGVDLTTEAALAAIKAYKLGARQTPDILAVSYSSHDLLGHQMGANSRELEELTIHEDRSLSDLFTALEKSVPGGMKNVLVVLTADHGIAPTVAHSQSGQYETGSIDDDALAKRLNETLNEKFGKPSEGSWISANHSLNFYLNRTALAAKKLELKTVADEAKRLLLKEKGVEWVVTLPEYQAGLLPPGFHGAQVRNTFVPDRSGDVVIITKPFFQESGPTAAHMTGYSYDSNVPIVIYGTHFKPGVYAKEARVIDIAPTLSFVHGVLPPATSEGRVLSEALSSK
jgi:predicted AlkP superfamily pyrophosphatase or phosphodiesterase